MMCPAHNRRHEWMTFLHSRYTNNARVVNPRSLRCGRDEAFVFRWNRSCAEEGPCHTTLRQDMHTLQTYTHTHTLQTSFFYFPLLHLASDDLSQEAQKHVDGRSCPPQKLGCLTCSVRSLFHPNQSNLPVGTQHMARILFSRNDGN